MYLGRSAIGNHLSTSVDQLRALFNAPLACRWDLPTVPSPIRQARIRRRNGNGDRTRAEKQTRSLSTKLAALAAVMLASPVLMPAATPQYVTQTGPFTFTFLAWTNLPGATLTSGAGMVFVTFTGECAL